MELKQVEELIAERGIEVVKVGGADMDGVYRGKRVLAQHFLDGCRAGGFPQCNVIFGWDITEALIDGLAFASADTGYGDIVMRPDLATFRPVPWEPGAAAVVCDFAEEDGGPVVVAPRQVLRRVVERAAAAGFRPRAAAEFEARLFREDQRSLQAKGYRDLEPLSPNDNCYSLHHASLDEDVVGFVRKMMVDFGVPVEGYNREHGAGMYEVNIRYDDALAAADFALLYKSGAKEIAAQAGAVPTFMAKYADDVDGCSGHMHLSLWSPDGERNLFADASAEHGLSATMRAFGAGVLATLPELMALYAPNVNSYKRLVAGSWAPTTVSWGVENRTAALRFIATSPGATRIEHRVPGADVNAYLGFAAMLAGGLHGIDRGLELPPAVAGDAYAAGGTPLPRSLAEAIVCFESSTVAREAFGDDFVDHYAGMRQWEIERHAQAVSDWERRRYFEQV